VNSYQLSVISYQRGIMSSLVYEKAYKLAIRIVNAYKYLMQEKKEFILSKRKNVIFNYQDSQKN
jgi:hypothetical protein